jgi:hypothetical protein
MDKNKFNELKSIWFIIALCILLINDFFLKELYSNWFTGKLSDFTGLFVFVIFWSVIFPKYKKAIFFITPIVFVFWKSHYSQFFINFWNSLEILKIYRVIDYTDLIALIILPLAYNHKYYISKKYKFKINPIIPLALSVFAFIATSKAKSNTFFEDGECVYHIKHYSRESFFNELRGVGLEVSSTKYHNTKYDDEHTEIQNLNDSIGTLVLSVGDFNHQDKTVEVSLGWWNYKRGSELMLEKKELEKHKIYVKSVFEENVINKLTIKNEL